METENLKFDKRRNRVKYCPCGKSNRDGKFVPYVGHEKKGYCHSCGETYLPVRMTIGMDRTEYKREMNFVTPTPTSYHDPILISQCGRNFKENNFVQFLKSVFSPDEVKRAILMYCIGTSKHWQGASIFWQIDNGHRVRHGKVMLYHPETGKRSKNQEGKAFISSVRSILNLEGYNLKQCLFGLHLINEKKTRTIALVEGEKTAIIMSIFKPEYLWMATGSKQGFKYEMLKPIKEYNVIAFPDKSEYYQWQAMAMELNGFSFKITVNDWMENQTEYPKGSDLADVFLDMERKPLHSSGHTLDHYTANELILTHLETTVNRLADKNPNLWRLIDEFGLTPMDGHEIRKVS